MSYDVGPRPGDLVVRRNRWSILAHTVGIVISRIEDDAIVWWSPTSDSSLSSTIVHIASSLTIVGDSNTEELRMRCLLAQ